MGNLKLETHGRKRISSEKDILRAREWYENNKERAKAAMRKNYQENSHEYKCRAVKWTKAHPQHDMWKRAKHRATALSLPFNLDEGDIVIPENCPVLGIELKPGVGCKNEGSPSLDRIIPKLGYVKGNVIVICDLANRIKTNATPDEILAVGNFYKELLSNDYPLFY